MELLSKNFLYENLGFDLPGAAAVMMNGIISKQSTEFLHTHSYHQVLLIKSGITLLEDEKRKQPLFGCMTAFIPAGFPHKSIVIGKSVYYQTMYLNSQLLSIPLNEIVIFEISELGTSLFNRLDLEEIIDYSPGLSFDCLNLFLQILAEDIHHLSPLVRLPEPQYPQNQKIIEYIKENYQNKILLKNTHSLLPLSPKQVTRVFQKDLGITIFEYIRLYRILMASIQLENKKSTITHIAYECGYESISCFYSDFNKYFSTSPSSFRKRVFPNNTSI